MCLAVPAQLVECEGDEAVADLHGNRVRINTQLVPEVKRGDWVLIHAGFAIQHLDEQTVEETWAVLEDLANADTGGQAASGTRNAGATHASPAVRDPNDVPNSSEGEARLAPTKPAKRGRR